MGFLFECPPVDEVGLARAVAPALEALGGALPDEAGLVAFAEVHGMDAASMLLFGGLRRALGHRVWIDALEQIDVTAPPRPLAPTHLLIVPGLFYREHPEVGAGGEFWQEVAQRCGLTSSIIKTRSLGTVEENSEIIWRALRAETHPRTWLLSMSKGSADLHLALSRHRDAPELSNIRGWINVSGLPHGTPLVDRILRRPLLRLFAFLSLGVRGGSLKMLRQLHPERGVCCGLEVSARLHIINVVGVPLLSHLREGVLKSYDYLRPWGPNDGTAPILRACVIPGVIYPVWGSDHYLRVPNFSTIAYRLMIHLGQRSAPDVQETA